MRKQESKSVRKWGSREVASFEELVEESSFWGTGRPRSEWGLQQECQTSKTLNHELGSSLIPFLRKGLIQLWKVQHCSKVELTQVWVTWDLL